MPNLEKFNRVGIATRVCCVLAVAALSQAVFSQVPFTTYHFDNGRTGWNPNESILTPAKVRSSSFGLLFSYPVDGQVYAEPLYLPNLKIPGKGVHNVVFIATEHNSVYAFDADNINGSNLQPLWHVNFGPSVPSGDTGSNNIIPEIGITGTPVIGTQGFATPILFVVSKSKLVSSDGAATYSQKLHALNVTTGAESLNGPLAISGQVPGTGDGSTGSVVPFNTLIQNNRAALLLVPPGGASGSKDSTLYVAFASHGDVGPYHGWLFVYDANKFKLLGILNTTPNALTDPSGYPIAAGGIWQGGSGPASDGSSVYFATGNGTFNPANGSYGDSVVRVAGQQTTIADFFAPANQLALDDGDGDQGSGGVLLLPSGASGKSGKNLLVQVGKEGTVYLLDMSNLGGNGTTNNVVQQLPFAIGGVWGQPAYFNNEVYFGSIYSPLVSFPIANGRFTSTAPTGYSQTYYAYPGPTPSISSLENSNGIVWTIQADGYATNSPAILHAYPAGDLGAELYNSGTNSRDTLGPAVEFTTPTVVNGKVYVGAGGSVGVFGLGKWAAAPTLTPPAGNYQNSVTVKVADATAGATIRYTLDGSIPTPTSTQYTKPILITTGCTLTVRAFVGNEEGSAPVAANYLINAVIGSGAGLYGGYFNGQQQNPGGFPTAIRVDPVINFNWNGAAPITGVAGTNWAGRWSGQIQAETTGTYTLTTQSDDGVQLYIDGQLVINDYNYHGPTYDSAAVSFRAGEFHSIEILYFQGGGGSLLQLLWSGPGIRQQVVPTTQLYPIPIN
jgi:hypothetical protein